MTLWNLGLGLAWMVLWAWLFPFTLWAAETWAEEAVWREVIFFVAVLPVIFAWLVIAITPMAIMTKRAYTP